MSKKRDPFEEVANSDLYGAAVNRSLALSHVGHEFFVRTKAELLVATLEDRLGGMDDLSILDVGCGVGAMQPYLNGLVGRSVGIDTSEQSIRHAKNAHPRSEFAAYDGSQIPFDDSTFDAVLAVNVLHHVVPADRPDFVNEMLRVTAKHGVAIVFEHNPLNPLTRLTVARCEFDEGVVLIGRRAVARLFEDAGGPVVDSRYLMFFPIDHPAPRRLETRLGWLPMGAQHMVVAIRS